MNMAVALILYVSGTETIIKETETLHKPCNVPGTPHSDSNE